MTDCILITRCDNCSTVTACDRKHSISFCANCLFLSLISFDAGIKTTQHATKTLIALLTSPTQFHADKSLFKGAKS